MGPKPLEEVVVKGKKKTPAPTQPATPPAPQAPAPAHGNVVIVNHGRSADGQGNVYTLYAHGSQRLVHIGDHVNAGTVVINSGNTGHVTGPHLHYEVIRTNIPVGAPGFYQNIDIRFGAGDLQNLLPH